MRSASNVGRVSVGLSLMVLLTSAVCLAGAYYEDFSAENAWYADYWDRDGGYITLAVKETGSVDGILCPPEATGPLLPGDVIEFDVMIVYGNGNSAAGLAFADVHGANVYFLLDADGWWSVFSGTAYSTTLTRIAGPTRLDLRQTGRGKYHTIKAVITSETAQIFVDGTKATTLMFAFADFGSDVVLVVVNSDSSQTTARFDNLKMTHAH
ncbi:MAG: hypothetical protein AB7V19_05240 [Candidatus Bipolaricaulia bacterium]